MGNYTPAEFVYLPHDQKHPRMLKVCVECGVESLQKVNSKGFCSRSCAQKGMNNSRYQLEVTYNTAHGHIAQTRGPAAEYDCVDCGGPAHEWAWNHQNGKRFSDDPMDYDPRCRLCHRAFDRVEA